jgi:hypothetical protein
MTMISRLEEGGWKLVHRQADPLIEPQSLERSIRGPSTSRKRLLPKEISTSSPLNPAIAMDLGMLVNFGDMDQRGLPKVVAAAVGQAKVGHGRPFGSITTFRQLTVPAEPSEPGGTAYDRRRRARSMPVQPGCVAVLILATPNKK